LRGYGQDELRSNAKGKNQSETTQNALHIKDFDLLGRRLHRIGRVRSYGGRQYGVQWQEQDTSDWYDRGKTAERADGRLRVQEYTTEKPHSGQDVGKKKLRTSQKETIWKYLVPKGLTKGRDKLCNGD